MPFLPPIGPLAAPGLPAMPLPGIPRPDFGALFDNQSSQGAPAATVPMAPSGVATPLVPPARSLAEPKLGPEASRAAGNSVGPRAGQTAMGIEPVFESIGNYLGNVNQLAQISDAKQRDLAMGKDVELHDVMIAAEKASVAVNLTMHVRNKLVESYQEVMRMQL